MRPSVAALAAVAAILSVSVNVTLGAPSGGPRIVALSPHLAELVFDAGAGSALVGAVEYTDYPHAARQVPRVGDAFRIDREQVAGLAPTLILAWGGGTPRQVIQRLRDDGYQVEVIESDTLEAVAVALRQIGELAGTSATARARADAYLEDLAALRVRYAGRPRIRVFFQIAERPLYTVTGEQTIGQLVELCGGENVFADLPGLAPAVSTESVVAADPEVMLATGDGNSEPLAAWRRFPGISAVRDNQLYTINGDHVSRATLRLLEGAREVCARLEQSRGGQPPERPRS